MLPVRSQDNSNQLTSILILYNDSVDLLFIRMKQKYWAILSKIFSVLTNGTYPKQILDPSYPRYRITSHERTDKQFARVRISKLKIYWGKRTRDSEGVGIASGENDNGKTGLKVWIRHDKYSLTRDDEGRWI